MTFEYIDPDGERVVELFAEELGSFATIHIPVLRVEELIAGIRDAARQAETEGAQ